VGVVFDIARNSWLPDTNEKGIGVCPLPVEFPAEASAFALQRIAQATLIGQAHNNSVSNQSICIADETGNCSNCHSLLLEAEKIQSGIFVVRTAFGEISRDRYVLRCITCQFYNEWKPESEFIHPISYTEGGKIEYQMFIWFLIYYSF